MSIIGESFGTNIDGVEVNLYTITNKNKLEVKVITYGGAIISLRTPDKDDKLDDVVLGYDNIFSYEKGDKFFGALIGRCANRIKDSKFILNNREYILAPNDGKNHLHGGIRGFDKVVWNVEMVDDEKNILKLYYLSRDGEEGYPGNLKVTVSYSLTDENELTIEYSAVSDKDTVVNLTNHSYFNLRGHFAGDMLNQKLMINSDMFTINDRFSIPTGEIRKVENTPMDFRVLKRIGEEIDALDEQIQFGSGYDHNWILNSKGDKNILAAKLVDEVSGRVMDVYTTNFGVQVYSGNFLDGSDLGKNNVNYIKRSGICLETQFVPNAINNSKFDTPILRKSDEYKQITIYKFSTL